MRTQSTRKRERSSSSTTQKRMKPSVSENEYVTPENERKYYTKTHATGGYCGNEYEIKLSGLIWLNLKYDDDVKDFLLATNVAAVCPLDDICFKITWKDEKRKPTMVFIQVKHKINDKNSSIELCKMFNAYKEIKKKMNEHEDGLFEDSDEFECYPILYTNNDFTFKTDPVTDNNYWSKLDDIFGTGGSVRKLSEKGNKENIKNMREKYKDWSEKEFNAFVNSLLVFTRQASEREVEDFLQEYIVQHHKSPFPLEAHAVTLTFIRMFVDWWKEVKRPFCLTKKDDLLENAFKVIIKSPWMSSLNIIYKSKINDCYEFTDDAVSSLNLQDQDLSTVITTENSALTVVKVLQHLDNKEHVVLDLEYIASCKMKPRNRKALCEELKTKEDFIVIVVCDNMPKDETFKDIGEVVRNLRRILIANNKESIQKLKDFFPSNEGEEYREVHDKKNQLTDMSEESQSNILKTATVMFQDKEVNLADIIDDESKKYIKGDVLHKIVCGNTIAVGKLIIKSNNYEMKHFWADRRVNCSNRKVTLKTLNDIEDSVVLVTAGPGMGKSTLLTQLSIETKEVNSVVWIVRINLLPYSGELRKWKEEKTAINLRDTLEFMCQVMLREKLGKENTVEITLEEKDNGVYLKHCTADSLTQFELNLFLHFYRERDIIFLIDGFDEIGPNYTDVVIKSLKTISNDPRKHRIWITSRPYNQIITILQKEFGLSSYKIERLSFKEMKEYLQKFWDFNLKFEELNSDQLDNVSDFFDYVMDLNCGDKPDSGDLILHHVSINAALYVSSKMKNMHMLKKISDQINNDIFCKHSLCDLYCICNATQRNAAEEDEFYCCYGIPHEMLSGVNPLIMYLAAVNVIHNIKYENKIYSCRNPNPTRNVYDSFLHSILKRQYQEKNEMKTCNPIMNHMYEEKVESSISKLKKMAHYSFFYEYSHRLYTEEDLKEINELIEVVVKGEEINELVESVACRIPIFIHQTLAEYLAVEHICDCLKDEENCNKTTYLELMFLQLGYFENLSLIFDKKLFTDKTLVSALENNKDVILKWILSISEKTILDNMKKCIYCCLSKHIKLFFERIICYGSDDTNLHYSERRKLSELLIYFEHCRCPSFYYSTVYLYNY